MKHRPLILVCFLFISVLLLASSAVAEPDLQKTTGLEWLQLSMGDRMKCIMAAIVLLDQSGVELTKSPNDYHNGVSGKLRTDPGLYSAEVPSILASFVYDSEPASQTALEKLRKK